MTRLVIRAAVVALAGVTVALPAGACEIAQAAAGRLVTTPFIDDFAGPYVTSPNPDYWAIDVGSSAEHGWEEGSLETYTAAADNIRLGSRLPIQGLNPGPLQGLSQLLGDRVLKSFTPQTLSRGSQWVFNEPTFVLLNVAVGGANGQDRQTPRPHFRRPCWSTGCDSGH